ncbi:PTS galactitol transporter subunit IIC [Planctomycetales bacterium]|nr:PTS galactitol transporter subunit IIC [Planctomycetales bacterium]GHT00164.1 PTS galactitol transporter subunit IIC [Planctomycetales bacterium]GHT05593.1 PTS galactitol transporter subunit IIC [Planctomycetales bacterium]GHV20243.1 PTS galactitol transporter subunit IIC [Planctomycetales bacterium]
MQSISYVIKDPIGIHARPAGSLIKELGAFSSKVTIKRGADSCDGKKLLALMKLKVKQGETVVVEADGADEEATVKAAEAFLTKNL